MKILELDLPDKEFLWERQRCCKIVQSTGTTYFKGQKNRCGRIARFNVDGVNFCWQHAGEMSLKYLIDRGK